MLRKLSPLLLGVTLVATGAAASAQTSQPARTNVAGDRWRAMGNIDPIAGFCHPLATPGEQVMGLDQGQLGHEMMRAMDQEVRDGFGMGPQGKGRYDRWAGSRLALSDEQRARTRALTDRVRKQHWDLRGKMMEEENRLRDLLEEPTPDPQAAGSTYAALSRLHQQMLETHLQARNEFQALLTPEQLKELEQQRRYDRSLERDEHGYRRGMTPR